MTIKARRAENVVKVTDEMSAAAAPLAFLRHCRVSLPLNIIAASVCMSVCNLLVLALLTHTLRRPGSGQVIRLLT